MTRVPVVCVLAAVLVVAGCVPPPPDPGPPHAVKAASTWARTCALLEDGTVRCWGANAVGQVGDGTNVEPTSPVTVTGLSDAVDLSTGMAHTCAARRDGTVRCWGLNQHGQLGDGTTSDSLVPVQAQGVEGTVKVAAATYHTCALDRAGAVACWGDNDFGQLGPSADADSREPVTVAGLPPVVDLAAGYLHTCAIDTAGDVWCWGANHFGILGNGQVGGFSATPTRVLGLERVTSVDAGYVHTCATRDDRSAWCWGRNGPYFGPSNGQLGDGTMRDSPTPVRVVGLGDVVEVSAGFEHTCAVRASGAAACWGRGELGELGNGEPIDFSTVPLPVVELTDAVGVTAGNQQTCAVRANGHLSCWGDNARGSLGAGGDEQYYPHPVTVWPDDR